VHFLAQAGNWRQEASRELIPSIYGEALKKNTSKSEERKACCEKDTKTKQKKNQSRKIRKKILRTQKLEKNTKHTWKLLNRTQSRKILKSS